MSWKDTVMFLRDEMRRYKEEFIRLIDNPPTHATTSDEAGKLGYLTGPEVQQVLLDVVREHTNAKGENIHNVTPDQADTYTKDEYDALLYGLDQGEIPISYYGDISLAAAAVNSGNNLRARVELSSMPARDVSLELASNGDLFIIRPTYEELIGISAITRKIGKGIIKNPSTTENLVPFFSDQSFTINGSPATYVVKVGPSYTYADKEGGSKYETNSLCQITTRAGTYLADINGTADLVELPPMPTISIGGYNVFQVGSLLRNNVGDANINLVCVQLPVSSNGGWALSVPVHFLRMRDILQRKTNVSSVPFGTMFTSSTSVVHGITSQTGSFLGLIRNISDIFEFITSPGIGISVVSNPANFFNTPNRYQSSQFDAKTGKLKMQFMHFVSITVRNINDGKILLTKSIPFIGEYIVELYRDAGAIHPISTTLNTDSKIKVTYVNDDLVIDYGKWGSNQPNHLMHEIGEIDVYQATHMLAPDNTLYIHKTFLDRPGGSGVMESLTRIKYDPSLKPEDIYSYRGNYIPGSKETQYWSFKSGNFNVRDSESHVLLDSNRLLFKGTYVDKYKGLIDKVVIRTSDDPTGRSYTNTGTPLSDGLPGPTNNYTDVILDNTTVDNFTNILVESEMDGEVHISQGLFSISGAGGTRAGVIHEDGSAEGSVYVNPELLTRLADEFLAARVSQTPASIFPPDRAGTINATIIVPQKFTDVKPLIVFHTATHANWTNGGGTNGKWIQCSIAVYPLNIIEGDRNNIINASLIGSPNDSNIIHVYRSESTVYTGLTSITMVRELYGNGRNLRSIANKAKCDLIKTTDGYMLNLIEDMYEHGYNAGNYRSTYDIGLISIYTTTPDNWRTPGSNELRSPVITWAGVPISERPPIGGASYTKPFTIVDRNDSLYVGIIYSDKHNLLSYYNAVGGTRMDIPTFGYTGSGYSTYTNTQNLMFAQFTKAPNGSLKKVFLADWNDPLTVTFEATSCVINGRLRMLPRYIKTFSVPVDVGTHHVWVYYDLNGVAHYDIRRSLDGPNFDNVLYIGTIVVADAYLTVDIKKNLSMFGHYLSPTPQGNSIPVNSDLNSPKMGWMF